MDANDSFRTFGQKMAIDPAEPDIVYAGTPRDGLFVTTDGGATWRPVAAVPKSALAPNGQYPGITGIVFDPTSELIGGRTSTIYASSYGNGVYRSSDAGASWSQVAGGPHKVRHAKIAADGAFYAAGNDGKSVWRYSSHAWTDITPSRRSWSTVVPDPFDPSRIIAVDEGGYLAISRDRGVTWIFRQPRRVATDIPWLAWTREDYMSVGDLQLDTATPNRLWFAEGIGAWYADLTNFEKAPKFTTFTSRNVGIEQLVTNQIIVPPDGKPIVAFWDRPVFYINDPEIYPSRHGPDNQYAIVMGWALDYASTDAKVIVGIFNNWNVEKSGYSSDGGQTWTPFPSRPSAVANGKIGGCIAASSSTNIIWVPSNNSSPFYTKDRGKTWHPTSLVGTPTAGETGWGSNYYLNRHIVAADRVSIGTFYLYNNLNGLYCSTDGGTTWKLVYAGEIAPYSEYNAKLQAVPGHAGHLFFTSGPQGNPGDSHPATNPLMRSLDGGATWTALPQVLEVRALGFGASFNDYPALFIVGWVSRTYGIWRSTDNARSWVKIGDFPLGIFANVTTIDADKDPHGSVYIGFAGSGCAYGSLNLPPFPSL